MLSSGKLEYTHSASAENFVGSNIRISGDTLSKDDSYSLSVKIGNTTTALVQKAAAGDTLADIQTNLLEQVTNHSDLKDNISASAFSEIIVSDSFTEGTVFSVVLSQADKTPVTISFTATAASSADYTVADIRTGLIDAINNSEEASEWVTAERGLSAGGLSIALNIGDDGSLDATGISWGSVDAGGKVVQASTPADVSIKLEALDSSISFAASASASSASGGANSAYSYDTDTFSYATADETGSLTAKLATITIIKDGGSLSVQDEAIVTDPSDETALPLNIKLDSITATGADQLVAASTAADDTLITASNELVQAKSNLAGLLMDEARLGQKS